MTNALNEIEKVAARLTKLETYVRSRLRNVEFGRGILAGDDAGAVLDLLGVSSFVQTILDDANGAAVFATMGAAQSLSTAGYQKLPSGMILQWGAASGGAGGTNVSFPTAFTTSAPRMAGACWTLDRTFRFSSFSTTGFHLDIRTIGGADSATTLSWIAAGY